MSIYPDLLYIQANGYGPKRSSTQMIVIHATDNTANALQEAQYAAVRTDNVSAHFYADDTRTIQALDTDLTAYGCYPIGNSLSVQFELCGISDQITDATMRQAAPIVARACAQYGLPVIKVSATDLTNGVKGICGHADVTAAWNQGDHTDPGPNFPWQTFIGYVQSAHATNLISQAPGDDDMPQGLGPIQLPATPNGNDSYSIWPVNQGAAGFGPAWLSIWGDLFGSAAAARVALSDGAGNWTLLGTPPAPGKDPIVTVQSGKMFNTPLPTGIRGISVTRVPATVTDPCTSPLSMSIEYGAR